MVEGAILWIFTKQMEIVLSACESEYIAICCEVVKEGIWILNLLEEIKINKNPKKNFYCTVTTRRQYLLEKVYIQKEQNTFINIFTN